MQRQQRLPQQNNMAQGSTYFKLHLPLVLAFHWTAGGGG